MAFVGIGEICALQLHVILIGCLLQFEIPFTNMVQL